MRTTAQDNTTKTGALTRAMSFMSHIKPLWRRLEWAMLFAGIALILGAGAAYLDGYLKSRSALQAFDDLDKPTPQSAIDSASAGAETADEAVLEEPDFGGWSDARVDAYKTEIARRNGTPIGVLEIPALGLAAPLLEGTDALTLNRGVGRITGTARPGESGNIGIAGHRDSFFRRLKNVKTGDAVQLKGRSGIDTYRVERIQIVSPRDVGVLSEQRQPALTLVTCYPFYFVGSAPQRFIVTAFLTQHTPVGSEVSTVR